MVFSKNFMKCSYAFPVLLSVGSVKWVNESINESVKGVESAKESVETVDRVERVDSVNESVNESE